MNRYVDVLLDQVDQYLVGSVNAVGDDNEEDDEDEGDGEDVDARRRKSAADSEWQQAFKITLKGLGALCHTYDGIMRKLRTVVHKVRRRTSGSTCTRSRAREPAGP